MPETGASGSVGAPLEESGALPGAIRAHQEDAVRPTENCLESLAGCFRRRGQLDNANEVAPRLHGIVQIARGRCRLCGMHGQERQPGRSEQAEQCLFLPASATFAVIPHRQVRHAVAGM
jgi:hypothetical protein